MRRCTGVAAPRPARGGKLSIVAERTPGTVLSLASSCWKKAKHKGSFPYFARGSETLNVKMMTGVKSRVNNNQADEAANEQAGTGEQDEGEAQLGHHKGVARK